jgi:hypothetical protein
MMASKITRKHLNDAAEELKKKFLEFGADMQKTFKKFPGGVPVSMKIHWKPSQAEGQVNCDIGIGFKLDEVKDVESFTFVDGRGPLFDSRDTVGEPGAPESLRPGIDYDQE